MGALNALVGEAIDGKKVHISRGEPTDP